MARSAHLVFAVIVAAAIARLAVGRRPSPARASGAARGMPRAIIVMGPSGCGKSTLARALAARCDWRFIEGDDHHPPRNIAKMAQGTPLNDEDRQPFYDSIGRAIEAGAPPAAVSCSALRRAHRDRLRRHAPDILFVWIDVPLQELGRRVQDRADHFMPASLLRDQLAVLEPPAPPERFIKIDGMLPPADQLEELLLHLRSFCRSPQAGPRRSA